MRAAYPVRKSKPVTNAPEPKAKNTTTPTNISRAISCVGSDSAALTAGYHTTAPYDNQSASVTEPDNNIPENQV